MQSLKDRIKALIDNDVLPLHPIHPRAAELAIYLLSGNHVDAEKLVTELEAECIPSK